MVKGITPAYANSIRRVLINKVPTMAIEDVEFKKNNSALYDEVVAHRLGLIPLKTDLKSYNLLKKCKCEGKGCAQCQCKLTLKGKGPKVIYASDLKSADPKVMPAYPDTPIVKLLKNQDIEFEATAVLGVGKEHIKWCPGLVFYKHKSDVKIKKDVDNANDVVKCCHAKIFQLKKGKLTVVQDNLLKCTLCDACKDLTNGDVYAEKGEDTFIFSLESWGQLNARDIIGKGVELFNETLDEFADKVKELK